MTAHRLVSVLVTLALVIGPQAALAQPVQAGEAELWQVFVERLPPAAFVSIRLKDGTRFEGTVLQAGPSEFVVKPHTRIPVAARVTAYADVSSVDVRKRPMSPGRKVVTGVAVGLGIYLLLAVIALSTAYD